MSLWKRIALLGILVLVALGIGYGLYAVFFRGPAAPSTAEPPLTARPGELPTARPGLPRATTTPAGARAPSAEPLARGGLTLALAVTRGRADAPTLSPDGRSVTFYDRVSAQFYRVNDDGAQSLLSDKKFYNVQNVTWAPREDRALIEYPDGSNIYFDFTSQAQVTLPKHWEDFSFAPDGTAIAGKSIGVDPENRWLFAAKPDGSSSEVLEPLGENENKVAVSWSPNNQVVAFSRTGTEIGFGREEIIPIGFHGENLRGLVVEGFGFQSAWMPDGRRLVYSVFSQDTGYRPELWAVDATADRMGEGRRRLNVGTWADKCVAADAQTLYCAVPRAIPEGAGFDRRVAETSPDLIYRVNLNSGSRTLVAEPDAPGSYSKLILSRDGKTLFLQETASGVLRRIKLP